MDLPALLARPRPLLLDGGMGSALIARGLEQGQPPERWNLEHPDRVQEVHAGYFAAGSEVVQTNTFGGNEIVLSNHGLAERMKEINRAAVAIARRAAEQTTDGVARFVAGNIGPSGLMMAPVGDADPDVLTEAFARQAAALEAAGADFLAIETMTDLREALCALRGARDATALPVTVCMTFDRKKRGFFTLMGDRMADAAQRLADAGAAAVGANCSVGSEVLVEATPLLVEACPVSVIIKPNAGLPEVTAEGLVYRQSPGAFAHDIAEAARLGAGAVGGCCGTDARFVAAVAALLDGA